MKFSCTEDYIFHTIQGEGRYTGVPSVFLRLSGCNLRCAWIDPNTKKENLCDTPYSSHQPEKLIKSYEEIFADLLSYSCEHIVITGGEPFLQKNILPLIDALVNEKKIVTIETNSSLYLSNNASLLSLSPKLSSSCHPGSKDFEDHQKKRFNQKAILDFCLNNDYQLKFVVNQIEDMEEIQDLLEFLNKKGVENLKQNTYLMPQAVTLEDLNRTSPWLIELCKKLDFNYCDRLHIRIWGSKRGV